MPIMIPLQKKFDINEIDNVFCAYQRVPYSIQVSLNGKLAEDGMGMVTIDGKKVEGCTCINAMGHPILLIPVGTIVQEYDHNYKVHLEGFKAENGKIYRPLTFTLHSEKRLKQDPAYAAHDEAALNAAREGMVLLKNDHHVLPLAPQSVLNCFGKGQHMYRITATGASLINPRWKPNFMEAVQDHSQFRVNEELSSFYRCLEDQVPDEEMLKRAKAQSDTAVVFLTRGSGESQDNRAEKGGYYLSDAEEQLLSAVTSYFQHTVLILNTGYPIDMTILKRYSIDAVLYTGFAGMLSSYALVEILDGRTNPSGKLAVTWPYDYYDNPVSRNFVLPQHGQKNTGEHDQGVIDSYEEGVYMGYRYFDTFHVQPAFCFGHGLSYTQFRLSCIQTDFDIHQNQFTADILVENTGAREGKEAVQLYVKAPDGRLQKPEHILSAFAKTRLLKPQESQVLHLSFDPFAIASYDSSKQAYVLEKGIYEVFYGNSLDQLESAGTFEVKEEITAEHAADLSHPMDDFHEMTREDPHVQTSSRFTTDGKQIEHPYIPEPYVPESLPEYRGKKILWKQVVQNPDLLDSFVAQMTTHELCRLNVNSGPRWFFPWQDGAAGMTAAMKKYGLPGYSVSDANAGLHLNRKNIGFPASSVIAQTFNRDTAYTVGAVVAEEAKENHIACSLGPAMNLQRGILNGRHPEYFSEDPLLAGIMAGEHGKGLEEHSVLCTYKHLFCNNSDTCRKASHSIVPSDALHDLYFKAFMYAFRIHRPGCIMTSYNALNGIYPAQNADLLQRMVRGEWKFDGWIMTDWDTYDTVDMPSMVNAGNTWISGGGARWYRKLCKAADEGIVKRAVLENNVRWILKTVLRVAE